MTRFGQSAAYTVELSDAILIGGPSNKVNALGLLPEALRILGQRVQVARDAMAQEFGGSP